MEKLIEVEFQKRKEIVKTFNKNYLLEAGAGAGKTTIIVERIINHIIDGKIDPKNIVAITFTKAASLELAERIEREALDFISKDESSKGNLDRVEEIFSGTIHSFCEMMLREMPFEAGLTPGYEIVEDSEEFYEEIWNEFLRNKIETYGDYVNTLNLFNIDYRDLKSGALAAMDNPDIEFVGFSIDKTYEDLKAEFQSLDRSSLNAPFIKKGSNLGKLFISMIEEDKDLKDYIDEILKEGPKIDLDEDIASKYIYKKNLEDDGVEDILSFIEKIGGIASSLNAIIYNTATGFVNLLADYKNTNYTNYLTFNDLLFKACQLIKTSKKAREHFKNKFKYFYIDEAQDTDPLQAELLLLLSHEGDIEDLKTFTDVEPKPGSLFIVADPKQSIYRFRRADISIYEAVKAVIDRSGEVVKLDINFRSTNGICSWVEESFKDRSDGFAFGKEASLTQAGFERILNFWKEDQKEDRERLSGVYKYEIEKDKEELEDRNIGENIEDEIEDEEKREIKEEEYIAELVRDIIDSKYIDEKVDRDKVIRRRVENKDIMILTKTNEETGIYLDELKRRDIPALLAGEKKLSDNRETLNLFLLLDFLVDSRDHIKFAAVLKNCFYLEIETVSLIFENSRRNPMFHDDVFYDIQHPHLKEAIYALKEIFRKSKTEDPIIFIEKLIKNKTGIFDSYKSYSDIEKRDADSSLIQTIELLKSQGPISLYETKEELRKLIDNKINYELPINLDFAENAVRVMNIHKSKGLESNIVILVGWDKRRTLMPDNYHVEKKENGNLGYIVYKNKTGIISPDENIRKDREREFKDAELDRLIYVAATRAKSVLIIPSIEDEKIFLYPLNEKTEKKLYLKEPEKGIDLEDLSERKKMEIDTTREISIKKLISKETYQKRSPSENDEFLSLGKAYNLSKFDSTPRGKLYGTIVHRAFEIILKDIGDIKEISEANIEYAIGLAIRESLSPVELDGEILKNLLPDNKFDFEIDSRDYIREKTKKAISQSLKKTIDSFINNELVRDMFSNARSIFVEFPFSVLLDPLLLNIEGTVPQLISGEIDLLIQKPNGSFLIVDYKTDRVDEASISKLKERYRPQLEIYKKSLEKVLKEKSMEIESLFIYSTYLEKMINLGED